MSRLPTKSLEPLFYNTFSLNRSGVDEECVDKLGYYIFGVPQHTKNISKVGFVFSLAHALNLDIIKLTSILIKKLQSSQEYWLTILDGEICKYFKTFDDFISELKDVFIGYKISDFIHWNRVFMDLAETYLSIKTIHFVDPYDGASSVKIQISKLITNINDYKSKNKHLIVIQKKDLF